MGQFDLSKQYMEEMLGKSLGLMKGAGTPQEMPWFKGMEDQINKGVTTQTSQVLRDATSRGIRGGTLEELLKAPSQAGIEGILKSILETYQNNPQQTMPFIKTAFDRQGQIEQMALQDKQIRDQKHQATLNRTMDIVKMGLGGVQGGLSSIQSGKQFEQLMKAMGGGAGGGAGCCFIFMAGNNGILEDEVRNFRDEYFPPDSRVAKGYKMMARYLVPWMKKSGWVKRMVKKIMLEPLSRVAHWHEGKDNTGWIFIPVGVFWCLIWGESARLKGIYDKLHRACFQRGEVAGENA
jgi:hypothetical protein